MVGGTPCMICGTGNPLAAPQCRECSAPMALVHDAAGRSQAPAIISIIGESNVGKTVYLGFLLDMLSQRAGAFEAIPRGAYSIDVQQNVIAHMARRMFPPKTPMEADKWYWAYYQISRREPVERRVDLIMPDMAGESLAAEVAAPKTFQVIRSLLGKTGGLILLVDAAMAANGSAQPDFFALKMLSYIDSMRAVGEQRITTPTAVVLCKADHSPDCFDDPRQFVRANLNRLWNLCESRFECVEFFASSVVGSLGYAAGEDDGCVVPVPLHTALRGVLEPFEWIIDRV